ncbi:MAG TPA: arylesterase, partial [Sphingomonadaceae bacterium]|nr:arylesterase [Sphingomonadaceae bacterium]
RCLSISMALALAACGAEAPAPGPQEANAAPQEEAVVEGPERRILAFGDSLFAGYRVAEGESYPDRLQAALRARGINAVITNGAVSGDTSAAALQRLPFLLDNLDQPPELAIVELGGNDLLRGLSPEETKENLATIIDLIEARGIDVLLVGMRAPPNLGEGFQQQFDALYAELAREKGVPLVPFFLGPVYDKPELMQADHIHPTAQGIEVLVEATVEDVVEALPESE